MCIAAFLSNSFRGGPALFVALLAIGMGLFIANGLLGFVKRTLIEAEGGWLTVRQRPFSWSREMSFKATEIEQLTSSQEAHHAGGPGQREYRMYGLSAVPKGGQRVKLLGHLPEAADALFIEQRVETALGLVDRPTGGELSR
jgi:hypothetical protein